MPDHPTRDDIQLLHPDFHANPFERFAWMRANAPVYFDAGARTWDGGQGLWGITRYEDIRHVASDQALFCSGNSSRPDSPPVPSLINQDEPVHMARRAVVRRRFTPQALRRHEAFTRACATEIIDEVIEKGEADFVKDIATPLPMMLIGHMLGVPKEDYVKLLHWSDLFATGLQDMGEEHLAKVVEAVNAWNEYITFWFSKRRAEAGDDLISAIVHARILGAPMTHAELMHEAMLILVGGDETTRHTISGGMEALLRRPAQMAALIDDASRLPVAIEEMLRWSTPVKNMNRTATADTEVGGQVIRRGDKLLLLYESGNRDETVFDAPDEFRIDRDPNHHLAFGGYGRHFCMGSNLARLEIRVMFEELLRRMPTIQLAGAAPCPYRHGNFVLGFEAMPVTFTPAAREAA
ncbi:MAG: cytochrome P450 [Pseudomonadales bacterium]|nr:cytochrome P450 [Pseudomonadales bacterium]